MCVPKRAEIVPLESAVLKSKCDVMLGRTAVLVGEDDLAATWELYELRALWPLLQLRLDDCFVSKVVELDGENSGNVRFPLRKGSVEVEVVDTINRVRRETRADCLEVIHAMVAEAKLYYGINADNGARYGRPLVKVRCDLLDETLGKIESELRRR